MSYELDSDEEIDDNEVDTDEWFNEHPFFQYKEQIKSQLDDIASNCRIKAYQQAENVIQDFLKTLPEDVATSTDFQSLLDAFGTEINSIYPDIQENEILKKSVFEACEEIILIFLGLTRLS